METISTDVIIIGAGPTGLSLACQFVRYGIDFVVVEKNETFTRFSKAIGVQARMLEIYDQLGLAQSAIENGEIDPPIGSLNSRPAQTGCSDSFALRSFQPWRVT